LILLTGLAGLVDAKATATNPSSADTTAGRDPTAATSSQTTEPASPTVSSAFQLLKISSLQKILDQFHTFEHPNTQSSAEPLPNDRDAL
jgi:hypothetical protein